MLGFPQHPSPPKVLIGKGFMIFGLVTYFRRAALEVVKAKIHRPLEGEIKTVTVSRRPQENILLLSCWKERKC